MRVYAVIDTNVIVSALLARNPQSATVKVLEAFWQGKIVPLVNDEIIDEYDEVLRRPKFGFHEELVAAVVEGIKQGAVSAERVKTREAFPDPKDAVFYEVALSKEDAYLITGNIKHFPHSGHSCRDARHIVFTGRLNSPIPSEPSVKKIGRL